MRSGVRFGAYGLAALGVGLLWVYAFRSVPPAPKASLLQLPGASGSSTEVIPKRRGVGHSTVTRRTERRSDSLSGRSVVGLRTPPAGRTKTPPASAGTVRPKGPRSGTAPGGTTPPTKPGGTTPPTSPGGTTPPTPAPPGPVTSPPAPTPSSPPTGGDVGGGGSGSPGSNGTPVAAPTDGGRTTAGTPPVQCPGPGGAVTNASVVVSNGVATATFQIAAGCSGVAVLLGTYQASSPQPVLFKTASGSFNAGGPFTLSANVPACQYVVDLMAGSMQLASASGGASCPPPPQPSPPPTPQPPCDHGTGQGDHHEGGGPPQGGTDTRPGWGLGDNNHDHSGPGDGHSHKGSP